MDISLHTVQRGVATSSFDELVVRPILHDPTTIDGDDPVASSNGGQAMGYDENRAPSGDALHIVLNDALALIIQRAGRFVKDQNSRIGDQSARDRNTLTLPARETCPALPDNCVVAFRQLQYEIMRAG